MNITALCCSNALYDGLKPGEYSRAYVEGVRIVETPCSGKVDPIYLLKAFEKGADLVVVLACDQRLCATIEGSKRIHKRIERTKQLLAEAGLEPERLVLRIVKPPGADVAGRPLRRHQGSHQATRAVARPLTAPNRRKHR